MTNNRIPGLISVIVPVYNSMDCLEKCVGSIRGQTYQELEILLVDDGSSDGTEKLVEKLAEQDERIRVFHKENGGSSSARNYGISYARGEWLGFVDSDDFIDPSMYEQLMEAALGCQVKITQVSRDEIDAQGRKLPDVCVPPKQTHRCSAYEFMRELLMHRGDCSFCTKLVYWELLKEERFPEGILNEDFYLLIRLLIGLEGIVILPGQLYHVFYRIGSNTRKKSREEFSRVFEDIVNHADWAEEIVKEHFRGLEKEAVRFALFQRLDYMLHIPLSKMTKENLFYQKVKQYLRGHWKETIQNQYLTGKNKIYLIVLTLAPKLIKRMHELKMKISGQW